MPGFDAGTVVSPLEFTLKPFTDVHGIVPEPTDDQIKAFLVEVKESMKSAAKQAENTDIELDPSDPKAFLEALDKFDPTEVITVMQNLTEAYARLCSNKPSAEDLAKVPFRVRRKFFEWIQGEVVNPEAGTGAGIAPVTPLKRAAAG